MSDELTNRLNAILPKVTSDKFLSSTGIGNEIPFHIFDYDPEDELAIDHLRSRELLEPCFDMQRKQGSAKMLEDIAPELEAERFAEVFNEVAQPLQNELILVSGIGSVWPLLRTHQLVSGLQAKMGRTPVVFFYPGSYDGMTLRLFGKQLGSTADPYYRAFKLVERGNSHAH